jgi:hypothetical protein
MGDVKHYTYDQDLVQVRLKLLQMKSELDLALDRLNKKIEDTKNER